MNYHLYYQADQSLYNVYVRKYKYINYIQALCLLNKNMLHCLCIQIVFSGFEHYLYIHPFSATYEVLLTLGVIIELL